MSSPGNNGQYEQFWQQWTISVTENKWARRQHTNKPSRILPFGFDHVRLYILWHTKFGANTYKYFTRHSMENAIFNVSIWLQSPLHELIDPVNTIH